MNGVIIFCLLSMLFIKTTMKLPKRQKVKEIDEDITLCWENDFKKGDDEYCNKVEEDGEKRVEYVRACTSNLCMESIIESENNITQLIMCKALPGESCRINNDCYSKTCVNGKCVGLLENDKCQESEECSPGLYCKEVNETGICSVLKEQGEQCEREDECVIDCDCNFIEGKGICTKYFSLKPGNLTFTPRLCESGFEFQIDDEMFVCAETKKLSEYDDCTGEITNCTYSIDIGNDTIIKELKCILSDGKKICPKSTESDEFKKAVNDLKEVNRKKKDANRHEALRIKAAEFCQEYKNYDKLISSLTQDEFILNYDYNCYIPIPDSMSFFKLNSLLLISLIIIIFI